MSNFFARLLNDSSSSDEEEINTWFTAAIYGPRVFGYYAFPTKKARLVF